MSVKASQLTGNATFYQRLVGASNKQKNQTPVSLVFYEGKSSQKANNMESVSMSWRLYDSRRTIKT